MSVLTQLFLNKSIQQHGKEGHNPIEDAQAAMALVNLKLEKGLEFGDAVLGGEVPSRNEEGYYTVSGGDKMSKKDSLMTSLSKTLADHEKTVALVCDNKVNQQYENFANFKNSLKTFSTRDSSKEAVEAATVAATEHNLTICHVDVTEEKEGGMGEDGEESRVVKNLKKFSKKMYDHTSVNGMFMIMLAGTKNQNSVAGIVVKKPEVQ